MCPLLTFQPSANSFQACWGSFLAPLPLSEPLIMCFKAAQMISAWHVPAVSLAGVSKRCFELAVILDLLSNRYNSMAAAQCIHHSKLPKLHLALCKLPGDGLGAPLAFQSGPECKPRSWHEGKSARSDAGNSSMAFTHPGPRVSLAAWPACVRTSYPSCELPSRWQAHAYSDSRARHEC